MHSCGGAAGCGAAFYRRRRAGLSRPERSRLRGRGRAERSSRLHGRRGGLRRARRPVCASIPGIDSPRAQLWSWADGRARPRTSIRQKDRTRTRSRNARRRDGAAAAVMEASRVRGKCHIAAANHTDGKAMFGRLIDLIGITGAALTTLCWLPQALKAIREKETRALSMQNFSRAASFPKTVCRPRSGRRLAFSGACVCVLIWQRRVRPSSSSTQAGRSSRQSAPAR